jgi:hypothetical protein
MKVIPNLEVRIVNKDVCFYRDRKRQPSLSQSEEKLVHMGVPLKIDSETLLCDLFESTSEDSKILEWRNPNIPGGYIKRLATDHHYHEDYYSRVVHINR